MQLSNIPLKYHGTACTGWFVLPIGFVIWRRRWLTAKLRRQTQVFSISHGDEGDEGREGGRTPEGDEGESRQGDEGRADRRRPEGQQGADDGDESK